MNMRNFILICTAALVTACSSEHPDFAKNLATAQELFRLHGEEAFEQQMEIWSEDVALYPPMYGTDAVGHDEVAGMVRGYQTEFDELAFTEDTWLPGTNEMGQPDGSVRTYGTWTGVHTASGKPLALRSYHYFNFDDQGKIIEQGDFFDYGGMAAEFTPHHPVVVSLTPQSGSLDELVALLESDNGLPVTRDWAGCISLEMFVNDATETIWVVSNWDSYDSYGAYLDWRQNEDDLISQLLPLLAGGEQGLQINQPNSRYTAY